jgi:hypothetical protein
MKKMIVAFIALTVCAGHAKEQSVWRHKGIYIINKSEGHLTISWDDNKRDLAPAHGNETSKILIPVTEPNVLISVAYSDSVPAYADMPSCRGGADTSFKTNPKIKLYEISGGHEEGRAAFNRPATGPHCSIKLRHQRFTANHAIQKYPELK